MARPAQAATLSASQIQAVVSLLQAFGASLRASGGDRQLLDDLRALEGTLARRFSLMRAWLEGFLGTEAAGARREEFRRAIDEAAVAALTDGKLSRERTSALGAVDINGLLGQHPRISKATLSLRLDSVWFPRARSATDVALELTRERAGVATDDELTAADRPFFENKLLEAGQQLSTRYVSYTYPAKYALEYRSRSYEVTLGDFYAGVFRSASGASESAAAES